MTEDRPPQEAKPHWTGISMALFVIGLLILVPSGYCAALAGLELVLGANRGGLAGLVLLFASVPMAVGVALAHAGYRALNWTDISIVLTGIILVLIPSWFFAWQFRLTLINARADSMMVLIGSATIGVALIYAVVKSRRRD
jgi:hypothetical protein